MCTWCPRPSRFSCESLAYEITNTVYQKKVAIIWLKFIHIHDLYSQHQKLIHRVLEAHLSSGHHFQQPYWVDPAHKTYDHQGWYGGQVATVKERVRSAQKSNPQANIHHEEIPHEDVDSLRRALASSAKVAIAPRPTKTPPLQTHLDLWVSWTQPWELTGRET